MPKPGSFIDTIQDRDQCLLNNLVLQAGYPQSALLSIRFGIIGSLQRLRPVGTPLGSAVKVAQACLHFRSIWLPRHPVHSRRSLLLQFAIAGPQQIDRDMVKQGAETHLLVLACSFLHTVQSA